ncbi:Cu(I)-responsive transcriptional regulator [Eikenella glucosivorans]|nr:Cu(I)-responsive transcriptional regulator [Eikenella glucosivorans]
MMNISQAAAESGLSAKQIRDYEKHGLLAPAERSEAGYRRYGQDDLARLRFIRHAREVGFSLPQIGRLLHLQDNPQRTSREVKALAAQHIAELEAQIGKLQNMVAELQRWHDACAGSDCPECAILSGLGED